MSQLSARHEAFAVEMAGGNVSASETYREHYPGSRTADTAGPRLQRSPAVKARIAELQGAVAERAVLTRSDLVNWCERVIMARPSDASGDSDICETILTKSGPHTSVVSNLGAAHLLMRLCSWDKGTVAENNAADALTELMQRLASGAK